MIRSDMDDITRAAPPARSADSDVTSLSPFDHATARSGDAPRLAPGQRLGPYRIDRLLGRGGMGEVYEAEHLEHGRRVALKVLNRQLAGQEDRARFLDEGRLAASFSHPHAVYIFGSEEIGGAPIIVMELVPGGTLKDRVAARGPLPPAEAVDAILQVLAGLEAAHAAGILHRDVKPANCFVDADGTVKVGDFGLSISTRARGDSPQEAKSTFQGTPAFAPPEQIQGRPLDVRADIYAAGATLFYLLTGRPPFDDADLTTLIGRVTAEAPPSPRAFQRRIPAELAAIVVRALAKDRAARPPTHVSFADALRPFASAAPVPATLGLRVTAGVIDSLLLMALTAPLTVSPRLQLIPPATVNTSVTYTAPGESAAAVLTTAGVLAVTVLYYAILEGWSDASIGKRLCGLRVIGRSGQRLGVVRASARALVFLLPTWLLLLTRTALGQSLAALAATTPVVVNVVLSWLTRSIGLLSFTSMRRRNGFAAWHDLATSTRVVMRSRRAARVPMRSPVPAAATSDPATAVAPARTLGPFDVADRLGPTDAGELFRGVDAVLGRPVWLHVLPPGSPSVSAGRRDLARPGRLRWLTGRRTPSEAWDAYEAPDGEPLAMVATEAQPWSVAKHWLIDVSSELAAGEHDQTQPVLSPDRVWITRASEARLLDFRGPGAPDGESEGVTPVSPQQFVGRTLPHVIAGQGRIVTGDSAGRGPWWHPVPISARAALERLGRDGYRSLRDAAAAMAALSTGADTITRWRRGLTIALANVPALFAALALLISLPTAWRVLRSDFLELTNVLIELNTLESRSDAEAARQRDALETYAAGRFRPRLADESFWRDRRTVELLEPLRPLAQRALANHPAVTADELAAATPRARTATGAVRPDQVIASIGGVMLLIPAVLLGLTAILSIAGALVFRGGPILRLLGVAIVRRDGAPVTRLRAGWRALVAWSPLLALWAYVGVATRGGGTSADIFAAKWLFAAAMAAMVAGAIWAIRHPTRGLPDRVTGTWLVPR
jgi:hypothetical protein